MFNIGFDAKRLFNNGTGLGNYSRSLVQSLHEFFPENRYVLFTPSIGKNAEYEHFTRTFTTVTPSAFTPKSLWRTHRILHSLEEHEIDIYHGLSHEIPLGIAHSKIKSVVTIHDLIYKFFPSDFPLIDKKIYDLKWRNACQNADAIVATSIATKSDIVEHFGTNPEKIHVVYQTCSDIFRQKFTQTSIYQKLTEAGFPLKYILYVGAIMERKNVLNLVKAYESVSSQINIPLVIVGKGRSYFQAIKQYVEQHNLQDKVLFFSNITNEILPMIYQQAEMFVYPSKYEGFGIPILEAMNSGVPVITSNISSLPEVGGKACYYADPYNVQSLADGLMELHENANLRNRLISDGVEQTTQFSLKNFAESTHRVYESVR